MKQPGMETLLSCGSESPQIDAQNRDKGLKCFFFPFELEVNYDYELEF